MVDLATINPSTSEQIRSFSLHSDQDVQQKLEKLSSGLSIWRLKPPEARILHLESLCQILYTQKQVLAQLISIERGKPIQQAIAEIQKCIHLCEYYQDICAEVLVDELVDDHIISYNPLGIIFGVMPWNYPFWQVFRFMIPTLLTGNTCIIKLADNVTGSAQTIESLMKYAGFPPNIVQFVRITKEQTHQIIKNPLVKGISFTGSKQVGQKIAISAAEVLKPCILELGGNDGYYIHHNAHLSSAVSTLVKARFHNNGQSCVSPKRIYIHKDIYSEALKQFIEEAKDYTPQNPLEQSSTVGPIAREDLCEKLSHQRQSLIDMGATLLYESKIPDEGYFFPITVMEMPENITFDEEIFGPILCLYRVENTEDAISKINGSSYGLGSGIFMKDEEEATELAYHT